MNNDDSSTADDAPDRTSDGTPDSAAGPAPDRVRRVNGESPRPRRRAAPASPPPDLEAKLGAIRRVLDAHKSPGGEDRRRGEPRGAQKHGAQARAGEALDAGNARGSGDTRGSEERRGLTGRAAKATPPSASTSGSTSTPTSASTSAPAFGEPRSTASSGAGSRVGAGAGSSSFAAGSTTPASASRAFDASTDEDSRPARFSYRGPLLAAAIVLTVLAIAAIVFAATGLGAQTPLNPPAAAPDESAPIVQAPASGISAANWVIGAVGSTHVVACDVSVCGYLRARGFPAQSLITVQAGTSDVEQADVLVSTGLLRSQFGTKLDSVLSPEPLAVFGGGAEATQVFAVALNGPSAYSAALRADRNNRLAVGIQLLNNPRLSFSPTAHTQLATGQVDTRVCALLALLAGSQSITVSGFVATGPGAGPDVPMPGVVIASVDGKPAVAGSATGAALVKTATAQQAPYVPLSAAASGSGVEVLFAQPGTLGLLTGATS